MKRTLLQILVAVLFVSCGRQDNSIATVNLSKRNFQEVSLRSNDFVKNWKVVKLETNETSLVAPYDYVYPTDSFIIIYNYNKILQFDYSGKFIREIAKYGESSYDISGIENCIVDSKQECLYFTEYTKPNIIRVFDLKNNSFKEPVPLASDIDSWLSLMYLIDDSSFLCFPQMGNNRQLCYVQDFNGNVIGGIGTSDIKSDGIYTPVRLKVMKFDNEWFYQGNYEDTMYNALTKEPVAVFLKGKNAKPEEVISSKGKDDLIYINNIFCTSEDYILSKVINQVRPSSVDGAYEMHKAEQRYYVCNWKDKTTYELKSFYIEPLNKNFEKEDMSDIFDKVSSLNHKKIVINIHPEDNDDNPTLFIGDFY